MRGVIAALVLGAALGVAPGGCTQYEIAKETVKAAGERAADETLDYAVFVKCRAATVGAVQRRYAGRMHLWTDECAPAAE